MSLNVISYNILNPSHAVKWKTPEGYVEREGERYSNWHDSENPRSERIIRNLLHAHFDIACLQEVNPNTYQELKEKLAQHHIAALQLSLNLAGPEEADEQKLGVTILYNSQRVECIAQKAFSSLTHTPWHRGEIWGDFRLKGHPSVVRVTSTHLKGYNPTQFEKGSEGYLRKQNEKLTGFQEIQDVVRESLTDLSSDHEVVAICGDFNCHRIAELNEPNSRHAYILDSGFKTDGNEVDSEARTYRKIDWIYVKKLKEEKDIKLTPSQIAGQDLSASDHYLIGTTIAL